MWDKGLSVVVSQLDPYSSCSSFSTQKHNSVYEDSPQKRKSNKSLRTHKKRPTGPRRGLHRTFGLRRESSCEEFTFTTPRSAVANHWVGPQEKLELMSQQRSSIQRMN
ncbi:hypothetical protein KSP39_PZI007281 [Platanthera zijinensis]|uniref:Uncharacterized protein n=1 Tax=Platanthera zijinensis TaxID=2320716 RepID=A0AAP0GA48_9ASPA